MSLPLPLPLPLGAGALLAAAAVSLASAAQATTFADNTTLATEGTLSVAGDDWLATSFVATEAVSSAETLLASLVGTTTAGSATLTLYGSDASGLIPDAALAAFTAASSSQSLSYTLTGTALAAGSTYWLVLANTSGSSTWGWTADGSGSGGGAGFTATWAASDDAGSTWFAQSTLYPLQASVSVGAVPEPATVLLWLAGAAVLVTAAAPATAATRSDPPLSEPWRLPMAHHELVNTPRRLLLRGTGAALVAAASPLAIAKLGDRSTVDVTEGPYFVDERLNRADLRIDPSDGTVQDGLLLLLTVTVSSLDTATGVTKPLANTMVDLWHCNALGLYSDVSANNTVGRKFLRGYQVSDAQGKVQFRTIYPGWYSGRSPHIHCKVRQVPVAGSTSTASLTTQFFFDESLTQLVYTDTNLPYYPHGLPDMPHTTDQVYQGSNSCVPGAAAGDSLKLAITRTARYASARFDILVDTGNRCTSTETGMGGGGGMPGQPPGTGGTPPTPPTR